MGLQVKRRKRIAQKPGSIHQAGEGLAKKARRLMKSLVSQETSTRMPHLEASALMKGSAWLHGENIVKLLAYR